MNKMELDAYIEEYPFLRSTRISKPTLSELNDNVESLKITIKAIDEEFLDTIPKNYYRDGSAGCTDSEEIVDFVLADGTVVPNIVNQQGESGSNYAHSAHSVWDGQSILDTIYQTNLAPQLRYIVFYEDEYVNWDQSTDCNYVNITIYILPKGLYLTEIIERKFSEIRKRIKEQIRKNQLREQIKEVKQ